MRNDHRSHNQRRSYDRSSQGERSFDARKNSRNQDRAGKDRRFDRAGDRGPNRGNFRGSRSDRQGDSRDGYRGSRSDRLDNRGRDRAQRSDRPFDKRNDDRKPRADRSFDRRNDEREPRTDRSADDRAKKIQNRRNRKSKASPARVVALKTLMACRERNGFAHEIMSKIVDQAKISKEDKAFARVLVLGVVSMRGVLDNTVNRCLNAPTDISPAVRDALDISTYEIIFLGKSAHAAVDQGVELVREIAPKATGLANSVLRRVVNARAAFPFGDPRTDIHAYARLHGFPVWLAERLIGELGAQGAHDFMMTSNEPAPIFVAINKAQVERDDEVVSILEQAHGDPVPVEVNGIKVEGCYLLKQGNAIADGRVVRLINKGMLLVSDATSQAIAGLAVGDELPQSFLEIGAGRATKTILDQSCALRRFGQQIENYVTVDNQAFKTRLLEERVKTYGTQVKTALTGDGTRLDTILGKNQFDTVFIDAPCSGLGTLRRHPEIRWRLSADVINEHAALDHQLLVSASQHVAPGGRLVYATCTVTAEENSGVVERFLASEEGSDFEVEPLMDKPFFSTDLTPGSSDAHFCTVLRKK